jgi:hypothetical protein
MRPLGVRSRLSHVAVVFLFLTLLLLALEAWGIRVSLVSLLR